jgi:hypothetical protein
MSLTGPSRFAVSALSFASLLLALPDSLPARPASSLFPNARPPLACRELEPKPGLTGPGESAAAAFSGPEILSSGRLCGDLLDLQPTPEIATEAFAPAPVRALNPPLDIPDKRPDLAPGAIPQASPEEAALIMRARSTVLNILQSENSCSAWLQRTRPDVAKMFASLTYAVERTGSAHVITEIGIRGTWIEHGPYIASTFQDSGPGTTITINANGAFFRDRSEIFKIEWEHGLPLATGKWKIIHAGPFQGGTLPAQAIVYLHELAHVIGAIPVDGPSPALLNRSQENTDEIVHYCKGAVKAAAKSGSHLTLSPPPLTLAQN